MTTREDRNNGRDAGHAPPDAARRARRRGILWRLYGRLLNDRADLIAAGVSFYLLLSLFPALAAFVSLFGYFLQSGPLAETFDALGPVLPPETAAMIEGQLGALRAQSSDALSVGFLIGFVIAFWLANHGIKALFQAMNVAFDEREKRGFLALNLTSFAFTLGAMLVAAVFIAAVGVVPAVLSFATPEGWGARLVSLLRWPVLFAAAMCANLLIYRFGPSRRGARLRWLVWGAGLSTAVWLAASIGFSWYLQNFANYNATYGSLGAVAIFMTWAWLSVFILIAGAEFSAEMERRSARRA